MPTASHRGHCHHSGMTHHRLLPGLLAKSLLIQRPAPILLLLQSNVQKAARMNFLRSKLDHSIPLLKTHQRLSLWHIS